MYLKKLRNDLILIFSLLLVAAVSLVLIYVNSSKQKLIAKVYVQNEVVETIDLSKKEEKDYFVNGLKGVVHIRTRDGGIAIVESNCPHQDCVHMGYVKDSSHPIICAYNAVCIYIQGSSANDVELG